jgi:PHD/YefM family antitoxin component YafN of YafNO toxin-antitoxin module
MINSAYTLKNLLEAIVPITRFNRGEAGKIFDEVAEQGVKVVVKNNVPTCILMDPGQYAELIETLEDYELHFDAQERERKDSRRTSSMEEVMDEFHISQADLDAVDVDLD